MVRSLREGFIAAVCRRSYTPATLAVRKWTPWQLRFPRVGSKCSWFAGLRAERGSGRPKRDASVEGVGDRGVAQRMRADVSRNPCGPGDALDHPLDGTSINRLAGERTQNERSGDPLTSACLEHSKNRDTDWHSGGLVGVGDYEPFWAK